MPESRSVVFKHTQIVVKTKTFIILMAIETVIFRYIVI